MTLEELGPFDEVLDVGGNVGEFAEEAHRLWPAARLTSFEPLPPAASANRGRAANRWQVREVAVSSSTGRARLLYCVNQHSASTLQEPGSLRRSRFGIVDVFEPVEVRTDTLDRLASPIAGERALLKIDVEGHELEVLTGAARVLAEVAVVVCEVNQAPDIFVGAPPPAVVDAELRDHGLFFVGVLSVQHDPQGRVVQFDGAWSR